MRSATAHTYRRARAEVESPGAARRRAGTTTPAILSSSRGFDARGVDHPLLCDCGATASGFVRGPTGLDPVCRRCRELEAGNATIREIVHELLGGPATFERLAFATGVCDRTIHRALRELERSGRVVSEAVDGEQMELGVRLVWRLR